MLINILPLGGMENYIKLVGKKIKGEGSVVRERKSLGEREGMLGWYGWKLSGKEGRGGEATSLPLLIFFHAIWMLKIWLQPQHLQNITPPFNLYFFAIMFLPSFQMRVILMSACPLSPWGSGRKEERWAGREVTQEWQWTEVNTFILDKKYVFWSGNIWTVLVVLFLWIIVR